MNDAATPATADEPAAQAGPERVLWRTTVNLRLDDGAATMKGLRDDIAANTTLTKQVQNDTSELVSLLNSFKGAFKVLEMLGKAAKPLGYITAFVAGMGSLWALWTGGGGPK
jgi:hypothetical protein